MKVTRAIAAALLALGLAACSIGRSARVPTTYLIDPAIEVSGLGVSRAEVLRIGSVRVAAPFAGSALVYRLGDVRYASDPYQAFVTDPGAMLDSRLAGWLERSGPFRHVVSGSSGQSAAFVLEASVEELYGDFRAGRPPAAVVSVRFVLIDQTGTRPRVAYERAVNDRVKLDASSAEALVRGYGAAFADILGQLAQDLSAQGDRSP